MNATTGQKHSPTDETTEQVDTLIYPDSYLLCGLNLYNWGPFAGRHHVDIDPRGTAIIGATGSGKTTLVDALMTLICERPKYNLASTGGHESDRDWISYVRGKSGGGNNIDDSHIARPGKTVSAIAARFSNGNEQVEISGIFWLDGSTSSQADLKRVWIFARPDRYPDQSDNPADLDNLLELHDQGGYRALKQFEKTTPNLSITKSKKAWLAQIQRFFGVGENAFTLLNRAAGLKQLNSIDELFRELVLDDNTVFDRAAEVVKGFDNLTTIHEELVIARKQHASLLPIQREWGKHIQLSEQRAEQTHLLELIPVWYAEGRHRLLQLQADELQRDINALKMEITELERQSALAQQDVEAQQTAYLAAGGGDLEELQRSLNRLRIERKGIAENANQYATLMRRLGLAEQLDSRSFNANQPQLEQQHATLENTLAERTTPWHAAITEEHTLKQRLQDQQAQIRQVAARPSSNIPPRHDHFRQQLAEHLQLSEDELPYLAELVEVQAEQADWRGAIERAIGAHRLRVLVPADDMQAALRWVNGRDNRLDVRLLEVKQAKDRPHFLEDGFVGKLNFKPHSYRQSVKQLLAGIDRHCVDAPGALRDTPHGLTREGLMSGNRGYFEKRDNTSLNQNWMTGFDNRDRLAQLQHALQEDQQAQKVAQQRLLETQQAVKQTEKELEQLQALQQLDFADIDVRSQDQQIAQYEQRIAMLQDPESDMEKARQRWQQAQKQSRQLSNLWAEKQADYKANEKLLKRIDTQKQRAFSQIGDGLDDSQREWINTRLTLPQTDEVADEVDVLLEHEKQESRRAGENLTRLNTAMGKCEQTLVRHMGKAQQADTGALSEVGTELRDIPDYLLRLTTLTREALPEKEKRFLDYLRESSDQSVTQLLSNVDNEVATIEERIEDLNSTMLQVDFEAGRYLRLDPQKVVHESIRTLSRAQRHLNSARLKDDQGESHYKALQAVVALVRDAAENRRKVGAKALLDPRYRLQFRASVIERQGQRVINTFSGSQGGSGGEKEIIASYILTASLSYALCPAGADRPLFGTIVLDEAFSKSSQAVAGRIVSALRQFGLHPLFVTPNKEMQLLRTHTRSAVLIHRKGQQATTTSMSWEELHEKAVQVREAIT